MPADYDGDGITDLAYYHPGTYLNWNVQLSGTASWAYHSGIPQQINATCGIVGDIPSPGDYDGDGKADWAIYRPSDGTFHITYQAGGTFSITTYLNGIPVSKDYNGDFRTDPTVYDPTNGWWLFSYWTDPYHGYTQYAVQWGGTPGDIPVQRLVRPGQP